MNKHYVEQFIKMIENLDHLMTKAAAYADHKKIDVNIFMNERLIVDMLPFARQIQMACDTAKFCVSYLSSTQAPKFEDNELTWTELKNRLVKTNSYLKTMIEADFSNFKNVKISPSWAGGQWLTGEEYFYQMAIPNFYFHTNTAYAILRKAGVEIGKKDFLGNLNFKQP